MSVQDSDYSPRNVIFSSNGVDWHLITEISELQRGVKSAYIFVQSLLLGLLTLSWIRLAPCENY